MAKQTKPRVKTLADIELHDDAWQRFEKFVDKSVRTTATPLPKKKLSPTKPTTTKRKKPTDSA